MRYFISPVEMIGTLGSATHIVFGINHYNFRSLFDVSTKVYEIEKIIGNTSEINVTDPLELCTLINLRVNDKMPPELVKMINNNLMFQIGDPKELEEYNCCETAYELDDWDEVNVGITVGKHESFVFINDGNGNQYTSRDFTSQTNFNKWNVDEDELASLAFEGFIAGLSNIKIKMSENIKEAIINRFLVDKTKRDSLRILTIAPSKLKKFESDYFYPDMRSQKGRKVSYNGTLQSREIFNPIMRRCRPMDLSESNVEYLIDYIRRI